jgi:hypothetical protein
LQKNWCKRRNQCGNVQNPENECVNECGIERGNECGNECGNGVESTSVRKRACRNELGNDLRNVFKKNLRWKLYRKNSFDVVSLSLELFGQEMECFSFQTSFLVYPVPFSSSFLSLASYIVLLHSQSKINK